MVDIDHFKQFNDTYGHALGDDILRMVIDFCRQNIRHTDILGQCLHGQAGKAAFGNAPHGMVKYAGTQLLITIEAQTGSAINHK